ncbi:MAG TPA: peptidoglycan-binding protein LysM [Longimicrobiales bacterium]|nr:peptidoglycan-binding protein LysM [Longimicrobiales bacterium]
MSIFDFVKDAGEKLFGKNEKEQQALDDAARGSALKQYVTKLQLPVKDLVVHFDGGTATVYGNAENQADKEKVILAVGNAQGVARVDDRITVAAPQPPAAFYTVRSGDMLSEIAKEHYGDAMMYATIFEANRPMLSDPDKIYPGQVLRIPPKQA